ncbi:MAG: hypothetical protein WCI02_15925 [Planctomycetota bacterium]
MLKPADLEVLARMLADRIEQQIGPKLVARQRCLVDRPTMAKLANVGTATLDRLVASKRVPSCLVGTRRLFDPDRVIDALVGPALSIDADAKQDANPSLVCVKTLSLETKKAGALCTSTQAGKVVNL